VPRKTGQFQADLYPPAAAAQSSLNFSEWASGENKPPVLQEFNPD